MQNLLSRLDKFSDMITSPDGSISAATMVAAQDINNMIRTDPGIKKFADNFAEHVLSPDTTQRSAMFKDAQLEGKENVAATVMEVLVLLCFYVVGKKKFKKLNPADKVKYHNSDDFVGRGVTVAGVDSAIKESTPAGIQGDEEDVTDRLVNTVVSIVEENNYDAFDDAAHALQYKLLNLVTKK